MAEERPPAIVPYLTVRDARAALDFYTRAFGGETLKILEGEGGIFHARTKFGDGLVMVYEERTGALSKNAAPGSLGGSPVSLRIELGELDAVDPAFERAIKSGATEVVAPSDRPWGRLAQVCDPEGHFWMLAATDTATT